MSPRSKRSPSRQPVSDEYIRFTGSVHFDAKLWRYDIAGSIAHAHGLAGAGVISDSECTRIVDSLKGIASDIVSGSVEFDPGLEDIHMNIEHLLTSRIGDAGAKLHTGRSRNDQVALDMRLYVRESIIDTIEGALALQETLLAIARSSKGVVMPGYTHLQHAQPVLLSHHLLAHLWRLDRDVQRLVDCIGRTNVSPLGSGALAGTSFKIDRVAVAKMLGMDAISRNSMDAVSDRDFVAETAFDLSLLQIHLTSLCEELILWSSQEFGFIMLPASMSGGSSMMPQKRNPDLPELIRGKSGRAVGDLVAILTLLKSLPLAYNRDLQEDKENLFDIVETAKESLRALTTFLAEVEFDKARMRKAAETGLMTATDLADLLTTEGTPFRKAHCIVKELAMDANGDDAKFAKLASEKLDAKGVGPGFFGAAKAVERRANAGGTATASVEKQMAEAAAAIQLNRKSLRKLARQSQMIDLLLK